MFKKENLRKNFLRVKQIADQNLGRVEKTEVLSDDLQTSEKKVELVKHVSSNTVKKLGTSLLGAGTSDPEKRLKKMPEAGLGHSMIESASYLGTECIMGQMYQMCGDCQNSLAQQHLQYELDVEKNVLEPLQAIVENEIPHIGKLKKALGKVTLDMDSAKSRHNSAVKQAQVPGVNMVSASAKVDSLYTELEDTQNRVEAAKDAYTTGMFGFISKEAEHSQNLLNLLEAQASYHQHALAIIETMIPKMRESLSCNPIKPVYGVALEEHLRVTNRDIAQVLEACVCFLLDVGLEEEGLFRIAGMASKVKKLKASFDAGIEFEDSGELDPHTVAGAFKQYLRELPEPLLTFKLFPDFMAAAQKPQDQRLQALWCVVDRLPKPNYDNFRYLIKFLSKLTEKSEVNKMTPGNIAIVIGPNLIWSEGDSGPNMMNTGILSLITELIVQHADWFFPGAADFQATQRDQAPARKRRQSDGLIQKQGSAVTKAPPMTTSKPPPITSPKPSISQSVAIVQPSTSGTQSKLKDLVPGRKTSEESVSSSSESTSVSEASVHNKEYENADTLERRDSVDHYLTARGDLSQSNAFQSPSSSVTNKRTNPIITFDPNERLKHKPSIKRQAPKPRIDAKPAHLQPTSPSSPSGHNVHSDMYSTAFALQSLGDGGTWPKYLNTVRSIWDDQLHNINFQCVTPQESNTPPFPKTPIETQSHDHAQLERTGSNQSSSSHGTPHSSPAANQDTGSPVTPASGSRSPSVSPAVSSSNLQGAPLAESEDFQSVVRRPTRKPAPPPPERPYSVAVSASVRPGEQASQYQTWPRQALTPQGDSSPSTLSRSDKQKTLPPDRPNPPERISSLQSGSQSNQGDRPKIPPPVVPPGHQRSASTGAPVTIPGTPLHHMDNEKLTGSLTPNTGLHPDNGALNHSQLQHPQDKLSHSSLNRHTIARPPRPMPPPPPPPDNSIVEQTHL
ncbi:rho GTPase-activating protein 44-like isoform X2 [Ruditapes philippinarum]|uniref:rho GTPase-activating protein 44-like isoform X2 n=1 Tax=Ruditapes philippinarum TaxID=129788 RepID=UPI00295AD020|nr:rho GTPase-activating protein 44-like isoform X2 [Ruditapes philippinarum]